MINKKDTDLEIFKVLQKTFLMGYLAGKGQIQKDAEEGVKPINQVITDLQQKIESLVPGSTLAADFNGLFQGLKKSEETTTTHYDKNAPQQVKLENQHDKIVRDLIEEMEKETKAIVIKATEEIKNQNR